MDLRVGDTIKCKDNDDLIETMRTLQEQGIDTDFLFEKDGEKGKWLIVEGISKDS